MKTLVVTLLLGFSLFLSATTGVPAQQKEKRRKSARVTVMTGKAWLGVELKDAKDVPGQTSAPGSGKGALVEEVVDESPADSAGILKGDVITEFDGKAIACAEDLVEAVGSSESGETVAIELNRNGERKTFQVVLGKSRSTSGLRALARSYRDAGKAYGETMKTYRGFAAPRIRTELKGIFEPAPAGVYGLKLSSMSKQLAEYFGAPEGSGVLVEEVKEDSRAAKAGFRAGDVILKAGKKTIRKAGDIRSVLGAFDEGEKIPFEILRRGTKQTLQLEAAAPDESADMIHIPDPDALIDLIGLDELDIPEDSDTSDIEDDADILRFRLRAPEMGEKGILHVAPVPGSAGKSVKIRKMAPEGTDI